MNIAVMSDLHIGLAARAKDLCPEPPTSSRKNRNKYKLLDDEPYRQRFFEFLKNEEVTADYLVLPGDITNQLDPREVELASEFILESADVLEVPNNKIIFVPGNHDVDWSVCDPHDTTGIRWGQRYAPIVHEKYLFRKLIDQGSGDIFTSPYFTVWDFDNLLTICYNSANHDTPDSKEAVHHGLAAPDNIDEIQKYLAELDPHDDRLRLFLAHHHVIDFREPIHRTPDFSLMTNAESLLTILHEYEFDLLIHGHKHQPRFASHSTPTYPHLPILCSGSFSAKIDTQWAGTIENQFHLIAINGKDGSENNIKGVITSWSNNRSRGWIPSEEATCGIHHITPFGSYIFPKELDALVEPFISQRLDELAHKHVLWKEVVNEFSDLEHLPLDSAIQAFRRIAKKLGKQSMFVTLKDLIIY